VTYIKKYQISFLLVEIIFFNETNKSISPDS